MSPLYLLTIVAYALFLAAVFTLGFGPRLSTVFGLLGIAVVVAGIVLLGIDVARQDMP
jgi:hypothetical protein